MKNTVSIINSKENILEFDLSIEGLDAKEPDVRFIVETSEMNLSFNAKKKEKNTWAVTIPPVPILERTAYNFRVEVVTEGYHFTPSSGTLNVKGPTEIYSSTPKNKTLETTNKEGLKQINEMKEKTGPTAPPIPKTTPKLGERSISDIARALVEEEAKAKTTTKDEPLTESVDTSNKKTPQKEKDEKILSILKESGFKTKKRPSQRSLYDFMR